MFSLLASFLMLAAGEPVAPSELTPAEVVRELKPAELAEWHNVMRVTALGQARSEEHTSELQSR